MTFDGIGDVAEQLAAVRMQVSDGHWSHAA